MVSYSQNRFFVSKSNKDKQIIDFFHFQALNSNRCSICFKFNQNYLSTRQIVLVTWLLGLGIDFSDQKIAEIILALLSISFLSDLNRSLMSFHSLFWLFFCVIGNNAPQLELFVSALPINSLKWSTPDVF